VNSSNICTVKSKIGGGLSKPVIYLVRGLTGSHKKAAIIKLVSIMPGSDQIDIITMLSYSSLNRAGKIDEDKASRVTK
jgi:hypothetical protein